MAKDKGRRFRVAGLSIVAGVAPGDELWESDLPEGTNVDALIVGGALREVEPETRPAARRANPAKETDAGGGDE